MTRINVKFLIWDKYNETHIKKHLVKKEEAETAIVGFVYHKKSHSGRYLLVGRSKRRVLSVILDRKGAKTYYVVTARDASKKERKKLHESESL